MVSTPRFRAKREQLICFQGLLPESQGQNLALTVLCVPHLRTVCPNTKSRARTCLLARVSSLQEYPQKGTIVGYPQNWTYSLDIGTDRLWGGDLVEGRLVMSPPMPTSGDPPRSGGKASPGEALPADEAFRDAGDAEGVPVAHHQPSVGSYLRLIDSCITQLKAQGPYRTWNESKEEEVTTSPQSGINSPFIKVLDLY